jgi:hypothetical protein
MLEKLLTTDIARFGVEVVLVDSASTDDTAEVMSRFKQTARFPVVIVPVSQPGLGRARNAGIQHGSGELFVFSDDDCYLAPDYFAQLDISFDSNRHQYGMASVLLYDPTDDPRVANLRVPAVRELPRLSLLSAGDIQGANMFFLRSVFEKAGMFEEMMGAGTAFPCEDIEMAARASLAGFTGVQLPQPVVHHHHGCKAGSPEADERVRQYDFGRGAYYASLLARGIPPVWDFWKAISVPTTPFSVWHLERLEREFQGAERLLAALRDLRTRAAAPR